MAEWILTDRDLGTDGAYYNYPELIRCKDCRYSYEGCTKYVCERTFHEFTVEPDGYCAWAERKEE